MGIEMTIYNLQFTVHSEIAIINLLILNSFQISLGETASDQPNFKFQINERCLHGIG